MAFVPGYDYDVFVSYAHADEHADASGRWVSQFVDTLRGALRLRLAGTEKLVIFRDTDNLHANQQVNELLTAARRSAVFLAIASRSYSARPWTRQELESFTHPLGDASRLFAVEILPLGSDESYPPPLQDHFRMPLWRLLEPNSSTPIPLSLSADPLVFTQRIHDLAEQIGKQLKLLHKTPAPNPRDTAPQTSPTQRSANYQRVLLAQVTDDLDEEREELRRYLEQFGVTVLPQATYPQGGADFATEFKTDLGQVGLFVQLLSRRAGRAPPDLPEGYGRYQFDAAVSAAIDIIQWRHPDLDVKSVTNPRHAELLSGNTVMASGLEALKAEVLRRATEPTPKALGALSRSSLVFIDADQDDTELAKTLQAEFSRNNFTTSLPAMQGRAEDVRADLEDNIVECDALVVVYGQTTPMWVRGQLRLYNKLKARRSAPPRLFALYTGPPESKPELGMVLPEVREIDARTAVVIEPVQALIAELRN